MLDARQALPEHVVLRAEAHLAPARAAELRDVHAVARGRAGVRDVHPTRSNFRQNDFKSLIFIRGTLCIVI